MKLCMLKVCVDSRGFMVMKGGSYNNIKWVYKIKFWLMVMKRICKKKLIFMLWRFVIFLCYVWFLWICFWEVNVGYWEEC